MRSLVPLGFVLLLAALLVNAWVSYRNTEVLADIRRLDRREERARLAVFSNVVGTALAAGLAVLSWVLVRRALRRRQVLADDYRRRQEWLRITLLAIGDGVIAADRRGRVTFLNPVAERLTGWPADEARGRPMAEVFRLGDEAGAAPEDPVRRVLREGAVARLAGRPLLLARDGAVRCVDVGGGTSRTPDGAAAGVVLVFRDVTAERRLEGERAEAARHKDEFLTVLAHELRNPLGPVRNAARLLQRRPEADVAARAVDLIDRQTAHLARLV